MAAYAGRVARRPELDRRAATTRATERAVRAAPARDRGCLPGRPGRVRQPHRPVGDGAGRRSAHAAVRIDPRRCTDGNGRIGRALRSTPVFRRRGVTGRVGRSSVPPPWSRGRTTTSSCVDELPRRGSGSDHRGVRSRLSDRCQGVARDRRPNGGVPPGMARGGRQGPGGQRCGKAAGAAATDAHLLSGRGRGRSQRWHERPVPRTGPPGGGRRAAPAHDPQAQPGVGGRRHARRARRPRHEDRSGGPRGTGQPNSSAAISSISFSRPFAGRTITVKSVSRPSSPHVIMSMPCTKMPSRSASNSSTADPSAYHSRR